jgi:hypothetical protein
VVGASLFYLLYAGAGFPGVILFRATLLAAACALVGLVAWRRYLLPVASRHICGRDYCEGIRRGPAPYHHVSSTGGDRDHPGVWAVVVVAAASVRGVGKLPWLFFS